MPTPSSKQSKLLHEIMQPLNIIRLSCGNVRVRIANQTGEDAEYLLQKMERIEEQIVRATELLQQLKQQNERNDSVEDS